MKRADLQHRIDGGGMGGQVPEAPRGIELDVQGKGAQAALKALRIAGLEVHVALEVRSVEEQLAVETPAERPR